MKTLITGLITMISISAFSQDLSCDDFLEGHFIGSTPEFPGVEWKIIRTKTDQVEFATKIPQKYIDMGFLNDSLYARIEHLGKCDFRFAFDGTKMKLDKYQQQMNNSGGLLVEKDSIVGKCYYYRATSKFEDTETTLKGKLCKIK